MAKKKSKSNQPRVPTVNNEASFVDKKEVIPAPPPPAAVAAVEVADGEDKPQEAVEASLKELNLMLVHRTSELRDQVSELSAEKVALEKVVLQVKEKAFDIEAEKEELLMKQQKLEDECVLFGLQQTLDSAVVSSQMSVCNGELVVLMEAKKEEERRKEAEMEVLKREAEELQRKNLEMEKSAMAAAEVWELKEKELRDAVRVAEDSVVEKSCGLDAAESKKQKLENAISDLNDRIHLLEESAIESNEREAALRIQAEEGERLKEELAALKKNLAELSCAKKEAVEEAESWKKLLEKLKLEKEELQKSLEMAAMSQKKEKEKLGSRIEELKVKIQEMETSSCEATQTWKLRQEELKEAIKTQEAAAREANRLLSEAEKTGEAEKQEFNYTISSLNMQISQFSVAAEDSKQKEEELQSQAEELQAEAAQLKERIKELEREIEELSGDRNRSILETKTSLEKITNLEEQAKKNSENWKITAERKEVETGDLKQRIVELEQSREEWQTKCKEFEELVAGKLLHSFRTTARTLKSSDDGIEARERGNDGGDIAFETMAALEALFEEELGCILKAFGEKGEEAAKLMKRAEEAEREVVVHEKKMKFWQTMLSSIAACAVLSIAVITKTRW